MTRSIKFRASIHRDMAEYVAHLVAALAGTCEHVELSLPTNEAIYTISSPLVPKHLDEHEVDATICRGVLSISFGDAAQPLDKGDVAQLRRKPQGEGDVNCLTGCT